MLDAIEPAVSAGLKSCGFELKAIEPAVSAFLGRCTFETELKKLTDILYLLIKFVLLLYKNNINFMISVYTFFVTKLYNLS